MTFPCWQCLSFGLNPRIYNSNKGKEVPSIWRQKRKQLVPKNERQRWSSALWTEMSSKESNCSFRRALSAFEKTSAFSPAQHEDFWHKYMSSKLQSGDRREAEAFLFSKEDYHMEYAQWIPTVANSGQEKHLFLKSISRLNTESIYIQK